jgi:hypothetical protein
MHNEYSQEFQNELLKNWESVLWREWARGGDNEYTQRLYKALYTGPLSWLARWRYRNQPRPHAHEVEAALHIACTRRNGAKFVWERRLERLAKEKKKSHSTEQLIIGLTDHHWLERFIARHVLLHRGGEGVTSLRLLADDETSEERETALWLLESIQAETTMRLAPQLTQLMCPDCLTHCAQHPIPLPGQRYLTFYGCRACQRSQNFEIQQKDFVAALDQNMSPLRLETDHQVSIIWFKWQTLFDFDWVEIIQANDEAVERFAVQVGNDLDPVRKPLYAEMPCLVRADCHLSENTLRVLDSIFGEVKFI